MQYLLPRSYHNSHIFKSVPYSLALRLVRICSTKELLLGRLAELKTMLISRDYNRNIINSAFDKVLKLDRTNLLKKRVKKQNNRVVLSVTFNPKLPSLSNIIKKHWVTLTKDPSMAKIFKQPPMIAFKQPPNLRNILCHAKLPPKRQNIRKQTGIKPCNRPCNLCPYILPSKTFCSSQTKEKFEMKGTFNCNTKGVIYLTSCTLCNKQYIGQTGRLL